MMASGGKKGNKGEAGERLMWLVVLTAVALFLGFMAVSLRGRQSVRPGKVVKPAPTEELFACGDYCPGPREKYLRVVYSDVKDEVRCKDLGGKWQYFTGWTTTYFCEVI